MKGACWASLPRDFTGPAPNRRWVTDFIHVAASAGSHKPGKLVLDALQMALCQRGRDGHPAGPGLVHHSDARSLPGNRG